VCVCVCERTCVAFSSRRNRLLRAARESAEQPIYNRFPPPRAMSCAVRRHRRPRHARRRRLHRVPINYTRTATPRGAALSVELLLYNALGTNTIRVYAYYYYTARYPRDVRVYRTIHRAYINPRIVSFDNGEFIRIRSFGIFEHIDVGTNTRTVFLIISYHFGSVLGQVLQNIIIR
jgi:hypothetical protein